MEAVYWRGKNVLSFDYDVNVHAASHHLAVDEIMRMVSSCMNRPLGAVKIGGYWLIGDTTPVQTTDGRAKEWTPIWGHKPGQRTRKFDRALSEALNVVVVSQVPFK